MTDLAPPTSEPVAVPMVQFEGVSKFFGELVAVSDITFTIGEGVTALLGPNGAGKSTVLRMLTGQAKPSKGSVRIFGFDPRHDRRVQRMIGVAPQQEQLFETQTAYEFVHLAAVLQGLEDPEAATNRALDLVELDIDRARPLSTYSKGMRQRVKLAQAIVHDPWIVVLDEPLTGLDPRQRLSMIGLLQRLGDSGRCVVVSSHILDEVERMGSQVLVIAKGRLAAEGNFHEIRELMNDRPHEIEIRSDKPRRLALAFLDSGLVHSVRLDDSSVIVETTNVVEFARTIAPQAVVADASVDAVVPLNDDLESVFRYLVGQ